MSDRLPLVAIGGTLCDGRVWQPALAQTDRETILLTAGRLTSGAISTTGDMAGYAAALLQDLPPRFMLTGFSLGGLVALELIARAPDRVQSLALICAGAGAETAEGAAKRRADEGRAESIGLSAHAGADIWPRFGATDDTHRDTFCAMAEATGMALYRRQNDLAISRADSLPRLANMVVPVLLVSGDHDPLCPPSRHEIMAAKIRNAQRETVKGAGHMVPLTAPRALAARLDTWLAAAELARTEPAS